MKNNQNEFDLYKFKLDEILTELFIIEEVNEFKIKLNQIIKDLKEYYSPYKVIKIFGIKDKNILSDSNFYYRNLSEFIIKFMNEFFDDLSNSEFEYKIKQFKSLHSINFSIEELYNLVEKNQVNKSILLDWLHFIETDNNVISFLPTKYYIEGNEKQMLIYFIEYIQEDDINSNKLKIELDLIKKKNTYRKSKIVVNEDQIVHLFKILIKNNVILDYTHLKKKDVALLISKFTDFSEKNLQNKLSDYFRIDDKHKKDLIKLINKIFS